MAKKYTVKDLRKKPKTMKKKYTTRDLKREVDRLNKEYKGNKRELFSGYIKFVFAKDPRNNEYYIGTKSDINSNRHKPIHELAYSKDIGKLVKEVRSKDFIEKNKKYIDRHVDEVFDEWLYK